MTTTTMRSLYATQTGHTLAWTCLHFTEADVVLMRGTNSITGEAIVVYSVTEAAASRLRDKVAAAKYLHDRLGIDQSEGGWSLDEEAADLLDAEEQLMQLLPAEETGYPTLAPLFRLFEAAARVVMRRSPCASAGLAPHQGEADNVVAVTITNRRGDR